MTETVVLEVPAAASLYSVIRLVVGGMAARADLTISEIDELSMAVEEVLRAAHDPASPARVRLEIRAEGGRLHILAGPFNSPDLPARLRRPCCDLILRVVDHDVWRGPQGAHSVHIIKARRF
ncbi:MAG: hypothetical protein GX537_06620 [Actinobacteria bacterium]|jgi:anti-sigma regulatory factor (Ser/Thr protein kinase)|nr:hypothetical protein [Actinomycetota bacterium]